MVRAPTHPRLVRCVSKGPLLRVPSDPLSDVKAGAQLVQTLYRGALGRGLGEGTAHLPFCFRSPGSAAFPPGFPGFSRAGVSCRLVGTLGEDVVGLFCPPRAQNRGRAFVFPMTPVRALNMGVTSP